jgi:FixJ family two-component response regulator
MDKLGWMTDPHSKSNGDDQLGFGAAGSMIYVVDDDDDVLKSLRFVLETEGFNVRTFRDAAALLESSTRNQADCFVIDYKMGDIDGLELAIRLRSVGVLTPVVLITGYPDDNISYKARIAGVLEVVLKPNLEDRLVNCVRTAINSNRSGAPTP